MAPAGFDEAAGELYYPRRSNGLYLMMIALLVIAVIALAFVTFRILDQMREKKSEQNESEPPTSLRINPPYTFHRS